MPFAEYKEIYDLVDSDFSKQALEANVASQLDVIVIKFFDSQHSRLDSSLNSEHINKMNQKMLQVLKSTKINSILFGHIINVRIFIDACISLQGFFKLLENPNQCIIDVSCLCGKDKECSIRTQCEEKQRRNESVRFTDKLIYF